MNYLYIAIIAFCLISTLVCIVMFVRVQLVGDARLKAIDLLSDRNQRLIDERRFDLVSWSEYENAGSFDAMLYDLRKWKFKQFFPELESGIKPDSPPAK